MTRLVYHRDFVKRAQRLPDTQQRKLARLLVLLTEDPHSAQLHGKRLSPPLMGLFSFRISRDWRVVFQFFDEETILLVDVAHRKDIYR